MNVYELAKKESYNTPVFLLQKGLNIIGLSNPKEVIRYLDEGYDIEGRYLDGAQYLNYTIKDEGLIKDLNDYFEREFKRTVYPVIYRLDFMIGPKECYASIQEADDARWVHTITYRKEVMKLLDFVESLGVKQDKEFLIKLLENIPEANS